MSPAMAFLASLGKFGPRGGWIPAVRVLQTAIEVSAKIAEQEVAAGRISQPDYYSKEIQRYEQSALGSTRVI